MAGFRGPILPPGGVSTGTRRRGGCPGGEGRKRLCSVTAPRGLGWWGSGGPGADAECGDLAPPLPSRTAGSWPPPSHQPCAGPHTHGSHHRGRAPGVNGPEKPSSGGRGAVMPVTMSHGRSHDPHHVLCSRVTPPCVRKRSGTERDHPTCRKMQGLDITTFPLFWLKINTYSMAISKF